MLDGLLRLGFDDVFEVSAAAELVSAYTRTYLKTEGVKNPQSVPPVQPRQMRQILGDVSLDNYDVIKLIEGFLREQYSEIYK